MANRKNIVMLEGGLTKDPEVFDKANVVHLSMAVDNAGSEKGVQYAPGYFDLKVWLNDSDYTPAITAKAVRKAIQDGTIHKGTRVAVIGTLKHERWEKDGQRSSKVVIVVDNIDIYTSTKATDAAAAQHQTAGAATTATDDDSPAFVPNF